VFMRVPGPQTPENGPFFPPVEKDGLWLGGRHGANGAHDVLKKQLFAPGLSVVRAAP